MVLPITLILHENHNFYISYILEADTILFQLLHQHKFGSNFANSEEEHNSFIYIPVEELFRFKRNHRIIECRV